MDTPIYMDNAATSWPKPEGTLRAMETFVRSIGANAGRSGHRLSVEAGRIIFSARDAAAALFHAGSPLRIILTRNATEGLNIAITGLLKPGDHVITSGMEHNSVMRPLRTMEKKGVALTVIPCAPTGELDPDDVEKAVTSATRAIYLTHASNVTGTLMPITEIGRIAREREVLFCVDAAQTAGAVPIDLEAMGIDLLAFSGHKSLLGPQGTGGLYIAEGLEKVIEPIMRGGTGSRSESEAHPDFMPDKYESGTANAMGAAGLAAGIHFIEETGLDTIRRKEIALTALLLKGLESIPGLTLYGCRNPEQQTAVLSFNIDGLSPADVALYLDEAHSIMTRPGLHCAPAAHRTLGTFPGGTVRLGMGWFTTAEEVRTVIAAIAQLTEKKKEIFHV